MEALCEIAERTVLENDDLLTHMILTFSLESDHRGSRKQLVARLRLVCPFWCTTIDSLPIWRELLASSYSSALGDVAVDRASLRRAFFRREQLRVGRHSPFCGAPRDEMSRLVINSHRPDAIVASIMREFRFALDVHDSSGAPFLSATFNMGPWRGGNRDPSCIRSCHLATHCVLQTERPSGVHLQQMANDEEPLTASIVVERFVPPGWHVQPGATDVALLLDRVHAHVTIEEDGIAALHVLGGDSDEQDEETCLYLHECCIPAFARNRHAEEEEEDEGEWLSITPYMTLLLPLSPNREPSCWEGWVTEYRYDIRDTTTQEMLALLRTLPYSYSQE